MSKTESLKEALEALRLCLKCLKNDYTNKGIKARCEAESAITNLESALSDDGWVSVEKENIEMKKLLNEMLQMKVCWKKNSTKNMWNRALAFIKDFKQIFEDYVRAKRVMFENM